MEGSARPAPNRVGAFISQLKLTPPAIFSLRAAPSLPRAANSNAKKKGDQPLPGTEAPLPLTQERLELIMACAGDPARSGEAATAAPPSRAYRLDAATSLPPPLLALASGLRTLAAVLILVALLPNIALGIILWLGVIDPPWSRLVALPYAESRTPAVQPAIPTPVLSAPAALEAAAGETIAFPIALDGTDGVPAGSIIVIRGLPPGSTLSTGQAHGETEWNVRPDEIGDLHLALPAAPIAEAKLTIQLVAANNGIVADTATRLKTRPGTNTETGAETIETALAIEQAEPAQALAASDDGATANLDASASRSVPLPTRRPAPDANDDAEAKWIKPSAYVNLRQGPSSSSPVVSVVAKGAKLRVMARKRGWVQVTNPATSHSGWIYAGNADTVR